MRAPEQRLDLTKQFLDLTIAVNDAASLSSIAVSVVENAIKSLPESWRAAGLKPQDGYVLVLLTAEQHSNVQFIVAHAAHMARSAANACEAVEALIAERARH